MTVRFEPLHDKRGDVVLYDIYFDGAWIGSRREKRYCEKQIEFLKSIRRTK